MDTQQELSQIHFIADYPDMGLKYAHARDCFIQPESFLGK